MVYTFLHDAWRSSKVIKNWNFGKLKIFTFEVRLWFVSGAYLSTNGAVEITLEALEGGL